MTLADQAAITAHDGEVTSSNPERPRRRPYDDPPAELGAQPRRFPPPGVIVAGPRAARRIAWDGQGLGGKAFGHRDRLTVARPAYTSALTPRTGA